MPGEPLTAYEVTVNGHPTTLNLNDTEARRLGLIGDGADVEPGRKMRPVTAHKSRDGQTPTKAKA